jgi:PPOX class probable F420-dependent enzyme
VKFSQKEAEFINMQRVARFSTISDEGFPHTVPLCYVFDGEKIFVSVHPKSKRYRNLSKNNKVSLVIDEYSEDWSKLKGVMVQGVARILKSDKASSDLMLNKYPQLKSMPRAGTVAPKIEITPLKVVSWGLK